MVPRIGVTTGWRPGRHGRPEVALLAHYLDAVQRAGGLPLLITPAHRPPMVRRLAALIDGLLLTGGDDVDPRRYGQAPHPALGPTEPARDRLEWALLALGARRGWPVLAICRGIQVLAAAAGGTLVQDIPSQRPGSLDHRIGLAGHPVRLAADSRVAALYGLGELRVNSFHHQAVDRLPAELRAVAWSPDGLIEAVEGTGERWIVGVQWHPERPGPPEARRGDRALFQAFVAAARAYRAGRASRSSGRIDR